MANDFSSLNSLTHHLHLALQKADAYFAAAAKNRAVTQRQIIVLQLLAEHPKMSQTQLVAM